MPQQALQTIDDILSAGRYSEEMFAPKQRSLLRSFLQSSTSHWVLKNTARRAQSQRHSRQKALGRNKGYNGTTLEHPEPTHTVSPDSSREPLPWHLQTTTFRVDDVASAPAALDRDRLERNEVALPPTVGSVVGGMPFSTQQSTPPRGDSAQTHPHLTINPETEQLTKSYQSIADIPAFLESMNGFLHGRAGVRYYDYMSAAEKTFGLYIIAKARENVSRAVQKVAALVFVTLYESYQVSDAALSCICQGTQYSKATLRQQLKEFRRLGRGCALLVEAFGNGCLFLLHGISDWGKGCESDRNKRLLAQSRPKLKALPKFEEQCEELEEPTRIFITKVQNEEVWQKTTQLDDSLTPNISAPKPGLYSTNCTSTLADGSGAVLGGPPSQAVALSVGTEMPLGEYTSSHLLLLLCCFLGNAPVPTSLLHRGGTAKRRWNRLGEVEEYTPDEAGIDPVISAFLADDDRLNQAFDFLKSESLIHLPSENSAFTVSEGAKDRTMEQLSEAARRSWRRQALLVVSHGFPRPYLDSEMFRDSGPLHLPHLISTWKSLQTYQQADRLSPGQRIEVSAAFLAASELPGPEKSNALEQARISSHNLNNHVLQTSVAQRESTLLRLRGDVAESNNVLNRARLTELPQDSEQNPRMNAQLGQLVLSQGLNLVQKELLLDAIAVLQSWSPLYPERPSTMERVVLLKSRTNLGKVLRYRGRFDEALACLEQVYQEIKDDEMFKDSRQDLICNLGDALIERERSSEARAILEVELNYLLMRGRVASTDSKLLQLSLAESYMQQRLVSEAEACYLKLSGKLAPRSYAELRWTIGVARVAHLRSHWEDAKERWHTALDLVTTKFQLGSTNNPYTAVAILKSVRDMLLKSGHSDMAEETFHHVRKLEATCSPDGCKHWIPGFSSYWLESI